MRWLLRHKIIRPLLLGTSLLAALVAFADIKKVGALMATFNKLYLLYFLLLAAVYTAVRRAQWHDLCWQRWRSTRRCAPSCASSPLGR